MADQLYGQAFVGGKMKRGCLTKNEVGQSFFIIKKHTKNTRNLKGIGHLRYNVGDESNTKPAGQL